MKISIEQTYINVGWNTKTGTISNKCEVKDTEKAEENK